MAPLGETKNLKRKYPQDFHHDRHHHYSAACFKDPASWWPTCPQLYKSRSLESILLAGWPALSGRGQRKYVRPTPRSRPRGPHDNPGVLYRTISAGDLRVDDISARGCADERDVEFGERLMRVYDVSSADAEIASVWCDLTCVTCGQQQGDLVPVDVPNAAVNATASSSDTELDAIVDFLADYTIHDAVSPAVPQQHTQGTSNDLTAAATCSMETSADIHSLSECNPTSS